MPTNLTYVAAGTEFVAFEWSSVPTATTYRVKYMKLSDATTINSSMFVNASAANITNLLPGTVYVFTVVARNDQGESMDSAQLRQITGIRLFR